MKNKKIERLKNMPIKIIIKKVGRKISKKIYYSYRRIKIKHEKLTVVDSSFHDFAPKCKFLYQLDNKEDYICKLNQLLHIDSIIIAANKICKHEFNILGSTYINLGKNIPWNKDFKTGFKWENEFYKDIKIVDLYNNADVKVPWELSRFQHLFTIGKAYLITNDEMYALEFKAELEDWIEMNPVEMSINWTCTMEVAIRAVNLICAYFFFQKSRIIDYKFLTKFHEVLYLHGIFIYKNLENEGWHNTNHYLSNLAGLIWLGIYFDNFNVTNNRNTSKVWLKFGIFEFEKEMSKEVNEDGTDYEASTAYHRLVTEIFLITTRLCNINNINFSKGYMKKLEKMCEFIMDITKPNGLSPIIGDADDGRMLILSNYEGWNKRDFNYVLGIAGEYFDRNDFRAIGNEYREDALWIMGDYEFLNKGIPQKSKEYVNGGYYILKNKRTYCIIRCGELSCRGEGGHSHNDQLSFELNIDGEDFIIDPGTYVYTADYKMRNLFRSTEMHNTIYIDNIEQNDFDEWNLFYMREQSFGKCKLFNDTTFCGEHYGYKEKCGVIHERSIKLLKNMLIIEDKLLGKIIKNKVTINFIIDKDVEIKEKANGIELMKNNKRVFLEFDSLYSIEDSFVSYGYGEKIHTNKLSVMVNNYKCITNIKLI